MLQIIAAKSDSAIYWIMKWTFIHLLFLTGLYSNIDVSDIEKWN